jgi:hypothetical protein
MSARFRAAYSAALEAPRQRDRCTLRQADRAIDAVREKRCASRSSSLPRARFEKRRRRVMKGRVLFSAAEPRRGTGASRANEDIRARHDLDGERASIHGAQRARRRRACIALLVLCSGCSQGALVAPSGGSTFQAQSNGDGGPPQVGDTIGIFELGAPNVAQFTLHGTLPLQKDVFPRADGLEPFVIVDPLGNTTNAQAEIVSRYPRDSDGADVVEILSQVVRPPASQPGDRLRYSIRYQPHTPTVFAPDAAVQELLDRPMSVYLRTKDCFGNDYGADLGRAVRERDESVLRVIKNGDSACEVATHETLVPLDPVTGPQGTLPHMMSAHAYFTRLNAEPFFALDLRIHNAASGADHHDPIDDPLGKLYFRSLELVLPSGWTLLNAFDDPYFGAPYDAPGVRVWPIVAPIASGAMHVMPPMAQFERRFVVAKVGAEARGLSHVKDGGLAFARAGSSSSDSSGERELDSWWNARTARYFPQRQRLPWLDFMSAAETRAHDQGALDARLAQVATGSSGSWPAESPGLGWAHPWGTHDGGMVSGEEIFLYDGVTTACAASTAGYRLSELEHRMYTDRQCNVLFDKNGLPTSLGEWIQQGTHGPNIPIWWYNEPMLWASDPFGFGQAPTFQQTFVAAHGLAPSFEADLLGYDPIDEAHLVRYTHNAKVLVWLGNDALAKDDLRAQAEGFRFAYHMYPQDDWGAVQPTGMLAARTYVDQHPAWGFAYGRGEAWGLDVMCAAYSTQDPAWRAETKPWFALVADLVRDGQCGCNGIIQSTALLNVFNAQYRCRQSIEAAITENALVGMRESVFGDDDVARANEVNSILTRSLYAMIGPLVWNDAMGGPQAMIAVAPIDGNQPPFCTWIPPDGTYGYADFYQIWSSFAYAYEITGDPLFLSKATQAAGGGDLMHDLVANTLDPVQTNLPNQVALLALMQKLHDVQH